MVPSAKSLLSKTGIPALLVTNLANIRYITGLSVSSGYLLVSGSSYVLFVHDLYLETATKEARDGIRVKHIQYLERALKGIALCGCEEETVTLSEWRTWKARFLGTKFVRTSGIIEECRRVKDADELKHVRRAHRITRELLRRIPSALRTGITEQVLAWKIETWAHELGAEAMSFPTIVAFGSNASRPHHHPGTKALKKGELVQIDVGAVYKGYCADLSNVYFTAEPSKAERLAFKAVEEARNVVMDLIAPGVSTHDLDKAAREVFAKYGLAQHAYTHALGHGVGLEVHESPVLGLKRPEAHLLKGEVIAVEPAVYVPGRFGIRLEEMVIVA